MLLYVPAPGECNFFTMKVMHRGQITKFTKQEYKKGSVDYFDDYDVDCMSMLELTDFAERLGYEGNVIFGDRVVAVSFTGSLKFLEDDMDVLAMVVWLLTLGVIGCWKCTLLFRLSP